MTQIPDKRNYSTLPKYSLDGLKYAHFLYVQLLKRLYHADKRRNDYIRILHSKGVSQSDIARAVKLSRERISQIVNDKPGKPNKNKRAIYISRGGDYL